MKLIVGLGNPGDAYARTRHNVGFACLDRFAERRGWRFNQKRAQSLIAEGELVGERIVLAKPQTFMNNSGRAVVRLLQTFRVPLEDLLVVYDDVDLVLGKIRLRERGGPGTHNGMRSVVDSLETTEFSRLRIGIGALEDSESDLREYVLSEPSDDEAAAIEQACERATSAMETWLGEGPKLAMDRHNR